MSESIRDRFAANFEQVKATGGKRALSIQKILKDAALQTFSELKEGGSELGKTAKDTFSSATHEWKNREGLTSEDLGDADGYAKPQSRAAFTSMLNKMKTQYSPEQLKEKLASLDANLASRYGQRYEEISQKRRDVLDWYNRKLATAESTDSNPIQNQQDFLDRKSSEAGASIAQKEQRVKQYLRTALRNYRSKS
jgi:hypothetical protein